MAGPVRAVAAEVVSTVMARKRQLDPVLATAAARLEPADRGLLAELCYGTLRFAPRLEWWLEQLMKRPLGKRAANIHALLMVGLYQLAETRVPPHAAVAESVEAARALGADWASGLVNAVLRRFQRERDTWIATLDSAPEAPRLAHPGWLLDALRRDWPDDFESVCQANNARAPMTLRVNARRTSVADYRQRLADAGQAAEPHPYAVDALVLAQPVDVADLPGFRDGDVSVQDAAAQLAVDVLTPRADMRVLDACAAPGGKTAHLLERLPGLNLTAIDADARRLDRVAETLARLGLSASLLAADAAEPADWWDQQVFDAILLDAPCSATGVIRRHPDIKLLRSGRDVARVASQQARLLDALWPLLAPGGRLVYATCSVLADENARQVSAFVQRTPDAGALPLAAGWGRPAGHGRQILPGEAGMDGFFYACLVKTA